VGKRERSPELSVGWVDPRVGLGWVVGQVHLTLGWVESDQLFGGSTKTDHRTTLERTPSNFEDDTVTRTESIACFERRSRRKRSAVPFRRNNLDRAILWPERHPPARRNALLV